MSNPIAPFYPIIYVRGYAMTEQEQNETTADPFNGFNLGSTVYRATSDKDKPAKKFIFESPLLHKIFIIISTINVLAAVIPVFILIAICSTISLPIEAGVPKPECFIKRMKYLNQGIMIGSTVLLFGIIHMNAWMQWPTSMFDAEAEVNKAAINAFAAISQYWGISFTLLLVCLYVSAAIYWQAQTRVALIAMQTDIDIPAWLEDNGFTVSWQKHALQLAAMLTPFIAGSFSITGRELLL
jgi:hypothetical protein